MEFRRSDTRWAVGWMGRSKGPKCMACLYDHCNKLTLACPIRPMPLILSVPSLW